MLTDNVITTLSKRIFEKISTNPKIMEMTSPWELFDIEGLKIDDLNPSLAQARHALIRAQECYEAGLGVETL